MNQNRRFLFNSLQRDELVEHTAPVTFSHLAQETCSRTLWEHSGPLRGDPDPEGSPLTWSKWTWITINVDPEEQAQKQELTEEHTRGSQGAFTETRVQGSLLRGSGRNRSQYQTGDSDSGLLGSSVFAAEAEDCSVRHTASPVTTSGSGENCGECPSPFRPLQLTFVLLKTAVNKFKESKPAE
ncbi:Hypothetical predicted protein [Xyrichtys novacula]|uniref:Uncharacterized protein n=1 Tax=Xyrichtys novacula TaxID=13765 RepID=A0AAV1GTJ1_XYRNO|nr:Hypothetical predicted protein [Xyrichtys novacula]